MQFEQRQRIDLLRENAILYRMQPIIKGDKQALMWIVTVSRGGEAESLDGATVEITCAGAGGKVEGTGSAQGNMATALLPDGSADWPGPVMCTMVIKDGDAVIAVARMATTAEDPLGAAEQSAGGADGGSGGAGSGSGTTPPASGEDGGYYTPSLKQLEDGTLRFTFTASKGGMPAVADVEVQLPTQKLPDNITISGTLTANKVIGAVYA